MMEPPYPGALREPDVTGFDHGLLRSAQSRETTGGRTPLPIAAQRLTREHSTLDCGPGLPHSSRIGETHRVAHCRLQGGTDQPARTTALRCRITCRRPADFPG